MTHRIMKSVKIYVSEIIFNIEKHVLKAKKIKIAIVYTYYKVKE